MQYNHKPTPKLSILFILKFLWFQDQIFKKIPPLVAEIRPDDTLLCK